MLSKHPYFRVEKMMLPRPQEKEQRVMLQGTFEVNGTDTITFACTHLDYFSEDTRFLQIQKITKKQWKEHKDEKGTDGGRCLFLTI